MDMRLLKSKLVLCDKSVEDLAKEVGISKAAMYRRINGQSDFSRNEVDIISTVLNLDQNEMMSIFFTEKVT